MKLGVLSVIATLLAIIVIGCTGGNEIAPATSDAAPAPGNGDPLGALYATPADVAFVTVSDGPAGLPLDAYAFLGYRFAAAPDVMPVVHDATLAYLELAAADAVAPAVDIDALFTAAIAGTADDEWQRGPETQQPLADWPPPPLDAK